MKRYLLSPLVGLFIIVCSFAVTTAAHAFTLRNLYLGTCLGVAAGNQNPGGKLVLWKCDGSTNQNFTAVRSYYPSNTNSYGEALYTLYNSVAGNRVLGVAPVANGAISAPVVTWTVDDSANQQWTMTHVFTDVLGHACYAIRSNGSAVLTMLTPSVWNSSIESQYYTYMFINGSWVITANATTSPRWGTLDQGDAVVASGIASSYVGPAYNPPPEYDPLHYAVQYWCAY
ncbi:MAG: hypothetical protein ABUS47_05850 [Steroidobacter sp.]